MSIHIRHFEDLGFTAVVTNNYGIVIEYAVYSSEKQIDGTVVYFNFNGTAVYEPRNAEPEFTGTVKWDGCSDWNFRYSYHGCCRENLTAVGEVMARCWDWTSELLENFDG